MSPRASKRRRLLYQSTHSRVAIRGISDLVASTKYRYCGTPNLAVSCMTKNNSVCELMSPSAVFTMPRRNKIPKCITIPKRQRQYRQYEYEERKARGTI